MADGKPRFSASAKSKAAGLTLDVAPAAKGWSVRRQGAVAAGSFGTKAEAIEAAKLALQTSGGTLRIHARNGQVHQSVTLGRGAAAKISAVEGISLDGEVRRELESFDREALSQAERRSRIGRKYGGGLKSGR